MLIKHLPFTQVLLKDHFIVVYLVAKPFILIEAEGDLVVIETNI